MDAVWVLNLDADLELGARGAYSPTGSVRKALRAQQAKLFDVLVRSGEAVVDESTTPGAWKGTPGRAFCPTPRALAILERAGAIPEPYPSGEVLRAVNGRAFCAALGEALPAGEFISDESRARAKLLESSSAGTGVGTGPWRVKRAFGMAGRGQRVIPPGPLGKADEAFLLSSLTRGGVVIEPEVRITMEVAIHGWLAVDGDVALGRLVRQRCDARGQWLSTEPIAEPFPFAPALEVEAARVALRLHEAGYFGPFGIDAFVYDGGFQPRSEINARFSMGFAIGMPDWRKFLMPAAQGKGGHSSKR